MTTRRLLALLALVACARAAPADRQLGSHTYCAETLDTLAQEIATLKQENARLHEALAAKSKTVSEETVSATLNDVRMVLKHTPTGQCSVLCRLCWPHLFTDLPLGYQ